MHDTFLAGCRSAIGTEHVWTEMADTQRFTHDFWDQYKGHAAAVLRPGSTDEVAAVLALASKHGVAIVPQAGNTGLVNGGVPDATGSQVVLSVERLDRIRAVDPAGDYLIAEAGCILDDVQAAAAAAGRLFPLAMGSSGSCRIGGNIATNAGGLNVLRYGMTRELVLGLEAVLHDGSILDLLRPVRKDNTGYDLKQLFIGSEGTLGVVTAAVLRLMAQPRERVTFWLAVETPEHAVSLFRTCRSRFGELISAFEIIASEGVEIAVNGLPGARRPVGEPAPWHVLIEVAWTFGEGLRGQVDAMLEDILSEGLCLDGTVAENEAQRANMWRLREGQSETARAFGYILRSDVAVAIADIPDLLAWTQQRQASLVDVGIRILPFGHIGDGNLHINFVLPPGTDTGLHAGLLEGLYDQVDRLGGSISAEHGVGRAKREAVSQRKSAASRDLSRRIKRALDPDNLLNPGVVLTREESSP
ncbi:FAD-binding oxidoreductase [Mesorhizobium sp. VNQ89]|uniref:FAD-binding oxidoreductase n=1 Tax=Mesorhizobium quangtriensis TaxID=3157709 RepID=UPI0032B76A27